MKKLIFTLAVIFCCAFAAQAQSTYKSAIGLRLGYPAAVSLKHFISEKGAVEAFVGFRGWTYYRAINIGAMYQHHSPIPDVAGLQWYVGGGASAWLWTYDDFIIDRSNYATFNIGIMGCLGLDYKFADLPLNASVDWVPTFIIGDTYARAFGYGYGALSARYTFK
jgi:hypothetical protein